MEKPLKQTSDTISRILSQKHRSKSFWHFCPKYSFRMVKIRSKRTKPSKMIHFCPNVLTENVVDFDLWTEPKTPFRPIL